MDIRKVKKLVELLEESNIDEIEIHEGDDSVRIRRSAPAGSYATAPAPVYAPAPQPAPAAPAQSEAPAAKDKSVEGHPVKSPMVGTFYSAPSPTADAFVKVGQNVNAGDVICIVEAMKILNEIESDRAGVIKTVLVQDGEAVEYGQPLFEIE